MTDEVTLFLSIKEADLREATTVTDIPAAYLLCCAKSGLGCAVNAGFHLDLQEAPLSSVAA